MNKIPAYPETDYSSRDWNNSDSDSEMLPKIFGNFTIKTKYGALAATATPFMVFGGVYIAWAYLSQASQRRKDKQRCRGRVLSRSVSIGALHSAKLALQRLIMYHEARANNEILETAECQLKTFLADEETLDLQKLQMVIQKMEMSGKEEQAVDILEKALTKANEKGKKHEAYEIGMSLVEMLIYKGDFSKAKACDCLNDGRHEVMSDARRPLYKAIIHIMVDDEKIAKASWDEFSNIREDLHCPPTFRESMEEIGIQNLSTNFDDFKKVVKRLKADIEKYTKKAKEKKVKK